MLSSPQPRQLKAVWSGPSMLDPSSYMQAETFQTKLELLLALFSKEGLKLGYV